MTTIAIVGAGPGLGAAVARRFGTEGFSVAVISRSQDRVDALAADLTRAGVTARGYAADVQEPDALTGAPQCAQLSNDWMLPPESFTRADFSSTDGWRSHASRATTAAWIAAR